MFLGLLFSLLVGCGLMALMFYSSRHGYDEAAADLTIKDEPRRHASKSLEAK
jgi:hypothetical protein